MLLKLNFYELRYFFLCGLHNLCYFRDPILLLHPGIGTELSV
jgi:hypothetical protein